MHLKNAEIIIKVFILVRSQLAKNHAFIQLVHRAKSCCSLKYCSIELS